MSALQAPTDNPKLSFTTSTRIGLWSTLASAGIGLFLALFQVQEWKMPRPLAIGLSILLLGVVGMAVSMIAIEISRVVRRYIEHRATSPSWVASEAPGLLDYEADGQRAMKRFGREIGRLANDTASLGNKLKKHTRRINRLKGKSAKRKQRRANRSAKNINRSAVYIEKREQLLRALVKDIERCYRGLISAQVIETEEDYQAVSELRNIMDTSCATTAESRASTSGYRESVQESEALNLSRTLRIASRRLAKALMGVETIFKNYEKTSLGLMRELDRKLQEWQP